MPEPLFSLRLTRFSLHSKPLSSSRLLKLSLLPLSSSSRLPLSSLLLQSSLRPSSSSSQQRSSLLPLSSFLRLWLSLRLLSSFSRLWLSLRPLSSFSRLRSSLRLPSSSSLLRSSLRLSSSSRLMMLSSSQLYRSSFQVRPCFIPPSLISGALRYDSFSLVCYFIAVISIFQSPNGKRNSIRPFLLFRHIRRIFLFLFSAEAAPDGFDSLYDRNNGQGKAHGSKILNEGNGGEGKKLSEERNKNDSRRDEQ